jgi:hypothetical protein
MGSARLVGFVSFLLFVGCASVPPGTAGQQRQGETLRSAVVAAPPANVTATPSTGGSTRKSANKVASSGAKTRSNIPASRAVSPASVSQLPQKDSIAPELATQIASPPFDLTSLKKRLKETTAIDVLAKVALKNQVDDLLSQLRAFHQGQLEPTLAELRRPYDLLVLKVLSLLQDNDPSLAAAIVASRETIWSILSDPAKFATI